MKRKKIRTKNVVLRNLRKISSTPGFTIIEILVVFTVVIILAGIGFASFSSYGQQQAVTQATNGLKVLFDKAKFNSLSQVKPEECGSSNLTGHKVVLCDKASCVTEGVDYELDVLCGGNIITIDSGMLPANVTIADTTTCTEVTYSVISNNIAGLPCAVTMTGYGNSVAFNPESGYISEVTITATPTIPLTATTTITLTPTQPPTSTPTQQVTNTPTPQATNTPTPAGQPCIQERDCPSGQICVSGFCQ